MLLICKGMHLCCDVKKNFCERIKNYWAQKCRRTQKKMTRYVCPSARYGKWYLHQGKCGTPLLCQPSCYIGLHKASKLYGGVGRVGLWELRMFCVSGHQYYTHCMIRASTGWDLHITSSPAAAGTFDKICSDAGRRFKIDRCSKVNWGIMRDLIEGKVDPQGGHGDRYVC